MSDLRDLTEKLRDNRDGVNFNLRLEAAAEIDDLRKSNTLLHGFVTNRDVEIARLSAAKTAALKLAYERAIEAVELREEIASADRACQRLCSKHGYATGHGDTAADMIDEISAQIPLTN